MIGNNDSCCVCLEEKNDLHNFCRTCTSGVICLKCAEECIKHTNTCPTCRGLLSIPMIQFLSTSNILTTASEVNEVKEKIRDTTELAAEIEECYDPTILSIEEEINRTMHSANRSYYFGLIPENLERKRHILAELHLVGFKKILRKKSSFWKRIMAWF